jgi:signal transduction histidine kinase/ActR/RegA family two-component response regulator
MQGTSQQLSTHEVARLLSLVESERRYFQEMVAGLPVPVATVDANLSFTSANRAFRSLFGLPLTGELSRVLDVAVPIDGLRSSALATLQTTEPFVEVYPRVATAAGIRPLRLNLLVLPHWDPESPSELLVQIEDLSNPHAENPVSVSQIQHIPVLFWTVDVARSQFLAIGGPGLTMLTVPRDIWAVGADFWSARVMASDILDYRSFYQLLLAGGTVRACDYRAASTGPDPLWLRDMVSVERLPNGTPVKLHGMTLDVTQTRRREDASAQNGKVTALARLASLTAHDCNNLLMIMSGHGEELIESLAPDHPLRTNVQEILYAGGRLSTLTRQLTEFVRHTAAQVQAFPIDAWLADIHWHIRQEVPRAIELVMSLKSSGAAVQADREVLGQVLQTLVQRAAEAMPTGGTLTIETAPYELTDAITGSLSPLPAGSYIQLCVRDTGAPIPANRFHRLFEPNINGEATRHNFAGLYSSVREMNGDLSLRSDAERGTVCYILLPRVVSASEIRPPEEPTLQASALETILVVEDERRIRALICKILVRYGYRTLEASDAREALDLARSHLGDIKLLLTDVVMPGLSGVELAASLRELRTDLKVLFISGYPGVPGVSASHLPPGSSFLQKPFTLQSLVAKVRETIGATRSSTAAAD